MTEGPPNDDSLGAIAADPWVRGEVLGVEITGEDALSFLQGQLSQDVASLAVGEARRSFLLEPDGTLGYLLWVARLEESAFVMYGSNADATGIEARLRRFKLRVKVELAVRELDLLWLGPASSLPAPDGMAQLAATEVPGRRFVGPHGAEGLENQLRGLYDAIALQSGSIEPIDAAACRTPHELGDHLVAEATSFTKGCYTGQELVARVDARGAAAPFRLAPFHSDGTIPSGAIVMAGDDEVGVVQRSLNVPEDGATVGFVRIARRAVIDEPRILVANGIALSLNLA